MKPAMVLNADYQPMEFPITITSGQQAINRIIAGSFRPINFHDDPIHTLAKRGGASGVHS
jgi:hypothetical protein